MKAEAPRIRTIVLSTATAMLLMSAIATEACAQNIAVQVIDNRTREPLAGVFAVGLDQNGTELSRILLTTDGSFTIPESVQSLRIEYPGIRIIDRSVSDLVRVDPTSILWEVSLEPVPRFRIPEMKRECVVDPDSSPQAIAAWNEAQKVLRAVFWSETAGGYTFSGSEHRRLVEVDGHIVNETTEPISDISIHPHALQEQSAARALVADARSPAYCLSTRLTSDPSTFRLLVLATEADSVQPSADLIVNAESSTIVSGLFRGEKFGTRERLEFARIDDGAWIVQSWDVEVTITADQKSQEVGELRVGGRIAEVRKGTTALFTDQRVALLSGSVYDSTSGDALSDAIVAVAGTDQWAATDATGSFFIAGYFEGRYEVVFGHPRLDSIGFISPVHPVSLALGGATEIQLTVPRLSTIHSRRCPEDSISPGRRALFGMVRDQSGDPVPGANVAAYWHTIPRSLQGFAVDDSEAEGTTDALGTFTLCGIAVGRDIVVRARHEDHLSSFVPVTFDGVYVAIDDQQITDRQIARLDLNLLPSQERTGSIQATVTDELTNEPIDGAEVSVVGTELVAVTDSTGYFTIRNLPPGNHRITARRVGYRRVRHETSVAPGEAVLLSEGALRMPSGVTELAPIVVEAEGVAFNQRHLAISGFFDRRDLGFGTFATREEIESWDPTETTDALRHIPGARIVPNPSYGINGDTRRYLVQTGRSRCEALIFLDGMYMGTTSEDAGYASLDFDTMINVNSIEGIEVYSGAAQIPARFNRTGSACGAIVIWTR